MLIILIVVIIRKGRKNNRIQETKAMQNTIAHHPLTNTHLIPEQRLSPFGKFPQFRYWTQCSVIQSTPLASLGQQYKLCSLLAF